MKVLVTGATGYIGGRLAPRLLEAGHRIRCLVRDASRLEGRRWEDRVDVAVGDVLDPETLPPALEGIEVAYYLIHSMGSGPEFHERDLRAARNFGEAARAAGVRRIVYLGGLARDEAELSEHLRSRQQTGDALREAGVPVTEFRAGVIVGSGSVSFEMIRYLTERLPVMVCPRWVYTRTQPIGVRDVLDYLAAATGLQETGDRVVEIGGADVLTYGEMMTRYAQERGLRRWLVPVPVLTPRLSSYWVNLVTPIPAGIARPLVEGLRNESVVRGDSARRLFPGVEPADYRTSVRRALARLEAADIETAWSDALSTSRGDEPPVQWTTQEGVVLERRQRLVGAPSDRVYRVFAGIGGARGWFYWDWAWRLRGFTDRLFGGVGLRRGRRDADEVRVGDALDFWRVEAVEPGRMMRLRAEMRLPGKAWLQFECMPADGDRTRLVQTAFFAPKGLLGWLYWYALYPAHRFIFSGLIDEVARRARP